VCTYTILHIILRKIQSKVSISDF